MNMKKISLALSFILISVTCLAVPMQQALERALSAKIEEETQQAAMSPTTRTQQIRAALQTVMEQNQRRNRTPMTFDSFLSKAHQLEQKEEQAAHFQDQANAAFYKAFRFKGQPQMLFQGTPDYAADLQGKKYIFIGEASDHDQMPLVRHTAALLKTLRKQNPNAKILLANEFSVVGDTHTWPIRFANIKNKNITTFEGYNELEPVADRLHIDILALDDGCFETDSQGNVFVKVGPSWVAFNAKDKRIQNIAADFGMDPKDTNMVRATFQYFLISNPYGVELRNRQWVSYIKAVEKYYDIIVVYAGNAHVDISGYRDSVALMLNPTQAVSISLYSTEDLSAGEQAAYAKREEIQNKFKSQPTNEQPLITFDEEEPEDDLDVKFDIDFFKPNYRRYDGKTMTAWYGKHIQNQAAFQLFKKQHAMFENLMGRKPLYFPQWLTLDVYVDGIK